MSTTVSTKVVNLRQQRYDVYIGRNPANQPRSKWGNPFRPGETFTPRMARAIASHPAANRHLEGSKMDRTAAIELYRIYLDIRIQTGRLSAQDFNDIHGNTLGCFCKPKSCHGDVIALYCQWFQLNPQAAAGPPWE